MLFGGSSAAAPFADRRNGHEGMLLLLSACWTAYGPRRRGGPRVAQIRLIGQPSAGQLGPLVRELLAEPDLTSLRLVVAWGKQSGLSRLANALAAFRDRGGTSEAVLGVDEGGATVEGLQLARDLFTDPFVFHDPGTRTFHPKLYVFQGPQRAVVAVGSWNLTRGGLFGNYEAGAIVDLDLENDDLGFLDDANAYVDGFRAFGEHCMPLDEGLIQRLVESRRFRVSAEGAQNRRRRARRQMAGEVEEDAIFGGPIGGLPGAPAPDVPPLDAADDEDDSVLPPANDEPPAFDQPADAPGFWKALSKSDASRTSSPGQIIIPIRFVDFFGEMAVEKDEQADGGVRQSSIHFPLVFHDGDFVVEVPDARAALYEPAEFHKRSNDEVRFMFRDRRAFDRLQEDDILRFTRRDGVVHVEKLGPDSLGDGRYGVVASDGA